MNATATPLNIPPLPSGETGINLVWIHWQASFRPSKADLLSEYVDPREEEHMKLTPKMVQPPAPKKSHKRKVSDISMETALTEAESDYSFLDECFKIPLHDWPSMNSPLARCAWTKVRKRLMIKLSCGLIAIEDEEQQQD